jgi:hypothetical protein
MVIVSEVASLARKIEKEKWEEGKDWWEESAPNVNHRRMVTLGDLTGLVSAADKDHTDDELSFSVVDQSMDSMELIVEDNSKGPLTPAQKQRIRELLGEWEEPRRGAFGQSVSCEYDVIAQVRSFCFIAVLTRSSAAFDPSYE